MATKRKRPQGRKDVPVNSADFPEEMDQPMAAMYLKVTDRTLRDWTKERRIAHIKIGRRLVYLKADLDAYKASCRVEAKPAPAA